MRMTGCRPASGFPIACVLPPPARNASCTMSSASPTDPVIPYAMENSSGGRRPSHPLTQARNPSRQLAYRGSQPSSFLAFSFE